MSTPDQIACARLNGCAQRCVQKRIPVDEAVASLRKITTRPDLLAQTAGILAGSAKPWMGDRQWHIDAARLLVRAGADRDLLPQSIEQGRRNMILGSAGFGMPQEWPDDLEQVLAEVLDSSG